jgi:PAS domain S-box-containing protein
VCSWMGIPLVAHGRMIGVLMVDHSDAGRYGQAELRLAAALAQHTAQAMENARLFEEMQILKAFNENIVRGIAEGILVEDAEGCITFVNPAMEAMLGYTGEELVGRHWATMIADDQSSFVGRHAVAGSEGVEGRYETTLLSKGGRRVPVMVSARPVLERGQVTGVLSAFTDISERVKAERAVEERRRYLEAVLTSVPDAIVTLDKQHRVVEWNPGAEVLFGYSPEETIGRELDSLVTAADTFEEATAITRRVMAGEDVPPTETVRYRQDGSPVAVTLAGSPILVGGEMTGIVGVYTDISERKEAERALVDSESRLSGILSSMVDLVFAFDREGRFTFYHAPSSDDLYVAPSEFLGQTHGRVMPAHIDELFAQAFEANREGRAARYEYWIDIGGQTRWFSVNLSPSFLQGEFRGSVAVARDITERTQAEEALRKANRGLRMLSECNAVLSRVREEPDLLHQVCQIAVEIGGYRMAWVGVPEQDEAKTVRPVAKAGFEDGYLDQVGISWADNERGRGPTGTAVRTHRPASAWNLITDPDYAPWREEAIRRGYASSVSLPLMTDGRCLGALSIFSSEPETFDPDEVSLLTELADNLAFGMAALRTRAERAWMEGVLQRYAERMEMLQEVGRAILEAQSPEAIAQATLARIGHLVPCQRASILAFGPEKTPRALAVRLSEGGTVGEAEPQDRKLGPEQQRSRDRISIPLMAQGELVGILRLTSFRPHAFSPEHIEIAYQVAAPLAVAIQHARLNEQLRTHAGSLEETVAQRTRELKAERDRTQAILESLGEAVMVTDSEGMILYANPATTALTGFPSEELLGQSWRLLQGDRQGDDVFEQAQEAMRAGQAWRSETSGRRPDDTQYDAAVTATPLFGSDHVDQVIGSVWVQRDITPLKEAERLKDQFISNVSHELRTPLSIITLIIGNLDRLYCRLEDDRRHQMIQSVREHVGVLNDLVGDVLEISRIDSGRISLERKDVDLAQLVREEMAKQQPLAARKLQRLEVIGASSLTFQGNEGQLRQILRNLLNNAIKFTPAGGDITCACRRGMGGQDWGPEWPGSAGLPAGFWAALFVMDNGVGIRRDDLPQLFERFYRVEAQGDIPGTGLGLAIARELVELHNGHIAVDSTLGEGSVFAVYLPLEGEDG